MKTQQQINEEWAALQAEVRVNSEAFQARNGLDIAHMPLADAAWEQLVRTEREAGTTPNKQGIGRREFTVGFLFAMKAKQ